MPLTDTKIKTAKSAEKVYKIYDAEGLYIEVPPTGKKRWRFKYRFDGKEKRISLGVYPDVSLKDARERRDEARKIVAGGNDPSIVMRSCPSAVAPQQDTFRQVAEEWIANRSAVWAASHKQTMDQRLSAYIYPFIGDKPIAEVSALDILAALRVVEKRGALEAARKTLGICSLICRYAVASARIPSDPCRDLRGALQSRKPGHFAAFTTREGAAQVVRAVRSYTGAAIVRCALELLALTFVRPGNIRDAAWNDFDLENGVWVIPAEQMKGRKEHVVPLARQACAVLARAQEMRDGTGFVFPSVRRRTDRRLSESTLNVALRSMGFDKTQMTAHGFRAMASSLLNEMGWPPDVIERQLAHVDKNKIRGVYNRAEYIDERRTMMQAWADYLDEIAAGPMSRQ